MISIILTIHNQEEIILEVLDAIFRNSSELVTELIILFDWITDKSEVKVMNYLEGQTRFRLKTFQLDNVFETLANNIGLKNSTEEYSIIIQDDCVINEPEFDKRMLEPMLKFPDVFAVTGRTAHNIRCVGDSVEFFGEADQRNIPRNCFAIRQVVNRGPLLLKNSVVSNLKYFDEAFRPQSCDDHDLCLKAYQLGYKCGCYWIEVISRDEWGGTRKGDGKWIRDAHEKNFRLINSRYNKLLENTWDEERFL